MRVPFPLEAILGRLLDVTGSVQDGGAVLPVGSPVLMRPSIWIPP